MVLVVKSDQCLEASEIISLLYTSLPLQCPPMALKGEWQISLPSFSPLPSRLTALWQSRGPRLGYSYSFPSSANAFVLFFPPPSPQLPSFCLNSREVGEKYLQADGQFSIENTYRSLSTALFQSLFTTIQTFWSCFILKYQNTKPTTMSNVCFCQCLIQ